MSNDEFFSAASQGGKIVTTDSYEDTLPLASKIKEKVYKKVPSCNMFYSLKDFKKYWPKVNMLEAYVPVMVNFQIR